MIVKQLLSKEVHHELLQFEALLALTNVSAPGEYKQKLVYLGVWASAYDAT